MDKIFALGKDGNRTSGKKIILGLLFLIAGLFLIFTGQKAYANYSILFIIIGLITLIVSWLIPVVQNKVMKLSITGTDLFIQNSPSNLVKVSVLQIQAIALRYIVGNMGTVPLGRVHIPELFVKQWGYLIKANDGQIYEIGANVVDYPSFLQTLKAINPAIIEDQGMANMSKDKANQKLQELSKPLKDQNV